jgi:hypothetical protein
MVRNYGLLKKWNKQQRTKVRCARKHMQKIKRNKVSTGVVISQSEMEASQRIQIPENSKHCMLLYKTKRLQK